MYLLAEIDSGGFIYVADGLTRKMLHRETRNLQHEVVGTYTLTEAKERRKRHRPYFACNALIVKLADHGGAERLYAAKNEKDEVTERLQVWKGCYGAWPVSFS